MRRFGGLVVGVLLLTGCGAGGGLAPTTTTTASAVSPAVVSSISHATTAAPASTTTRTITGTTTAATSVAIVAPPDDAATAVALVRAVMEGDQTGISRLEPGGQVDPYYRRFIMMSSPTLDGQPTKSMSGIDAFHVNVRVKTQDGQTGTLKFDVNVDTVGDHTVKGLDSGLYPDK